MARYAPPRNRFSTIRSGSSGCCDPPLDQHERGQQDHPGRQQRMVTGAPQPLVSASDSP